MQYAHKKKLAIIRVIYMSLFIISLFAMNIGQGAIKTALTTLSLFTLVATVYLVVRYEMTTYTYVINEKDTDFDFYVNKAIGRRGDYVCYYYMSDVVEIVKHTKETRDEYAKKYQVAGIYSFYHNFTSNDKYIVIFKNTDYYDMIILEMNDEFFGYFDKCAKCADTSCRTAEKEDNDQDEIANDTASCEVQENNISENTAQANESNSNESLDA